MTTTFMAPNFYKNDFNYSSNDAIRWVPNDKISILGNGEPYWVWRKVNPNAFSATISFVGYNDLTTNFPTFKQANGVFLGTDENVDPTTQSMAGVSFETFGGNPAMFVITDQNGTLIWGQAVPFPLENYPARVSFTTNALGTGSSYDLTIHIEVPTAGIDHTEIITNWKPFTLGNAYLTAIGPYQTAGEEFLFDIFGWADNNAFIPHSNPPFGGGLGVNPKVILNVSRDGGNTWSNDMTLSLGKIGEYTTRLQWRRLGRARSMVFRVRCTEPVDVQLMGAWLTIRKGLV